MNPVRKLSIDEALVIIDKQSSLNRQIDNFINPVKLFARSNNNHQTLVAVHTRNDTRVDCHVNACVVPSIDVSCVRDDENSSRTRKFIDVLKFPNKISRIIIILKNL